jgi:hypothetical protein
MACVAPKDYKKMFKKNVDGNSAHVERGKSPSLVGQWGMAPELRRGCGI